MLSRQNLLVLAAVGVAGFAYACGSSNSTTGSPGGSSAAGASGSGTAGSGGSTAGAAGSGGSTAGAAGSSAVTCMDAASCQMMYPPSGAAIPPPAPSGAPGPTGSTVTNSQVVSQLDFGDLTSSSTWTTIGFDLDGLDWKPGVGAHCQPMMGGNPVKAFAQGMGGIDNSFGHNIVPLLTSVVNGVSTTINGSIAKGSFSIGFAFQGLGMGANYMGLSDTLYPVGTPTDPSTMMPVTPPAAGPGAWTSFSMWTPFPDPSHAGQALTVPLTNSYVNNNEWVSGAPSQIALTLSIKGTTINLTISHALAVGTFDSGRTTMTGGIIGGALKTADFVSQIKTALCALTGGGSSSTYMSILNQLADYSDIYLDANGTPQLDPTQTCNAISIGIGFTAYQVASIGSSPLPASTTPPPAGCM